WALSAFLLWRETSCLLHLFLVREPPPSCRLPVPVPIHLQDRLCKYFLQEFLLLPIPGFHTLLALFLVLSPSAQIFARLLISPHSRQMIFDHGYCRQTELPGYLRCFAFRDWIQWAVTR